MLQYIILSFIFFETSIAEITTIDDILMKSVPNYTRFFTVDELFNHARTVAFQHPDLARYQIIGYSRNAEAIPMLSMGNGSISILLYACPHPNEPIGSLLVDFLLDALVQHQELLINYTWHLLPCVDPDGTRLNEGWFAGPFTIRHYAQYYYRPAVAEQVEWTFPIVYKNYSWNTPSNETQALMTAIQITQPDFVYGLHNSGFGGMYFYISSPLSDIFLQLEQLPPSLGLFLAKGEPEAPWLVEFAPAIFSPLSLRSAYDYYEKYTHIDPVTVMSGGGTTFDYLETIHLNNTIFFMAELPYFQSPAITNDTLIPNVTQRDDLLAGLDKDNQSTILVANLLERIENAITLDSACYRAFRSLFGLYETTASSRREAIINDNSTLAPATVATRVDALYISVFYKMLILSMLDRTILLQLKVPSSDIELLLDAHYKLQGYLDNWIEDIEQNLPYSAINIRTLVQAQLGAMLIVLHEIRPKFVTEAIK